MAIRGVATQGFDRGNGARGRGGTRAYSKGAHVLTPGRARKAAQDFAAYRGVTDAAELEALFAREDARRVPDPPPAYGMPNSHCPGSIALAILGGRLWRGLTPGGILD